MDFNRHINGQRKAETEESVTAVREISVITAVLPEEDEV